MPTVTEATPPIPLNDLSRGIARDRQQLLEATQRVLDSGYVIHGPEHRAFERELAEFVGVAHAVGLATGTDALELAIKAAMPANRSAVLTAANAGGYTSTAARRGGFSLVYADVNDETLCLDISTLEAALTPEVGVVVMTHLYGQLSNISEIVRLCTTRGIALVEDCAQAIGAKRDGVMAGAFGDLAAISFYPTKNLGALGDGGAVVTNSTVLADRLRSLRQYGWGQKYNVELRGGVNSRLDELQAAYLRVRLPLVNELNERRRLILSRYRAAAANLPSDVLRVASSPGAHHVAHLAVARSDRRDEVRAQLAAAGVATDIHFPVPDYDQVGFASTTTHPLPVTAASSREILSLPCFPEMTNEEIDRVCAAISSLI